MEFLRRLQSFLLFVFLLCASTAVWAEWFSEQREYMGTEVRVEFWSEDASSGAGLVDKVFAEFDRLDQMMNPWNPASELARVNRQASQGAVTTTPEIVEVVARALHYSRLSDGAFDISFASVGQHYDYRKETSPDTDRLQKSLQDIDYRAIHLDVERRELRFSKPGLQVDLGGIAKGYAVDRGIGILSAAGIRSAVVSAGGDSRVLGDLGDRPRTIGIRHPRDKDQYVVVIPLADTAISTSGDYERFFIADGKRFHHILDPSTGQSSKGVQSASVIAPLAMDSDALSTTTFVLGVKQGLALINGLPGVDAIIIDGEGALHYSDDLLLSTTE